MSVYRTTRNQSPSFAEATHQSYCLPLRKARLPSRRGQETSANRVVPSVMVVRVNVELTKSRGANIAGCLRESQGILAPLLSALPCLRTPRLEMNFAESTTLWRAIDGGIDLYPASTFVGGAWRLALSAQRLADIAILRQSFTRMRPEPRARLRFRRSA